MGTGGGALGNFNFSDKYQESFRRGPQQLNISIGPQAFRKEFAHSIRENKSAAKLTIEGAEKHLQGRPAKIPILTYKAGWHTLPIDSFQQYLDPSVWQEMTAL